MKTTLTIMFILAMGQASSATIRDLSGYLPLDPGMVWNYAAMGNNTWSRVVEEEQGILGRPTMRIFNHQQGPDYVHGFYQFWSQDEEGSVFLHGFESQDTVGGRYYEPPILWVSAQAEPGDSWNWSCTVYSDPAGTQFVEDRSGSRSCTDAREVVVIAGTFFSKAYSSQDEESETQDGGHDLSIDGSLNVDQPPRSHPETWFSWGVGVIRASIYVNGWTFLELTDWDGPVRTQATTWSNLKAYFR